MDSYRINEPAVQSDIIDGEAVVINMDSGKYYCLNRTGSILWRRLRDGATVVQLTTTLASACGVSDAEAGPAAATFVDELKQEALLAPGAATPDAPVPGPSEDEPEPFVPPRLEAFTDMEAFLLVDPVHEIDEKGIPQPPANE